jgi:hypothetical protein
MHRRAAVFAYAGLTHQQSHARTVQEPLEALA